MLNKHFLPIVVLLIAFFCFSSSAFAGGLKPQKLYTVGNNADGSDIGDLDGDGKNELAVGGRNSKDFYIFKSAGPKTDSLVLMYIQKVSWSMGVVVIADVNGDGLQDLVVDHYTDYAGTNKTNTFGVCFQNASTHKLDPEQSYTFPSGTSSRAIDVGDVNSDGKPEIVVANEGSGDKMFVFAWDAAGSTFKVIGTYGTISGQTISISIGDITGDKKNDVVLHGGTMSVFSQNANGTLDAQVAYSGSGEVAAIGDLNNDGLNELAGNSAGSNSTVIWSQDANHKLFKSQTLTIGGYTEDVEISDLNKDGRQDLIVADRDNSILFIFYQTLDGKLTTPVKLTGATGKWLNELAVGDLNEDGYDDVIGANWGAVTVGGVYPTTVSVWFSDYPTAITAQKPPVILRDNEVRFDAHTNTLQFELYENGPVSLFVSDITGRRIALLQEQYCRTGCNGIALYGHSISAGMYIALLKTSHGTRENRLIFVK